jgi:hypothetical protein
MTLVLEFAINHLSAIHSIQSANDSKSPDRQNPETAIADSLVALPKIKDRNMFPAIRLTKRQLIARTGTYKNRANKSWNTGEK